jgi:hypothetical protein
MVSKKFGNFIAKFEKIARNLEKFHQTLESTKLKEIHIIKKEKGKKPLIGKMKQSPLW